MGTKRKMNPKSGQSDEGIRRLYITNMTKARQVRGYKTIEESIYNFVK
jgi:hypothetical protein